MEITAQDHKGYCNPENSEWELEILFHFHPFNFGHVLLQFFNDDRVEKSLLANSGAKLVYFVPDAWSITRIRSDSKKVEALVE